MLDDEYDLMFSLELDSNVVEALGAYVALGLEPGSFTNALLFHDLERAYRCAHHLLMPENNGGCDIVANLMRFTKRMVPEMAQGSADKYYAWIKQRGYMGTTEAEKVQMALLKQDTWWTFPPKD